MTVQSSITEENVAVAVSVIAATCHEVNRAYCEAIGDFTIKPWETTDSAIKQNAYNGVMFRLANPLSSPQDMHANWVKDKVKAGWVYGEVKDAEKLTHPCIVPYAKLPESQRIKDNLFMGVVDSLRKTFEV